MTPLLSVITCSHNPRAEYLARVLASLEEQRAAHAKTIEMPRLGISHPFAAVLIAWDKDADVIHVVDHGRIVESGTAAELFEQGGLFARLAAQQSAA